MDTNENSKFKFKETSDVEFEEININSTISVDRPKTLFDLQDAIKKYASIISKRDKFSGFDFEKNKLYSYIARGIDVTDFDLKNESITAIIDFFKQYGYSDEFVKGKLKDVSLFSSAIETLYDGKLVAFGEKIGIDFSYLAFDDKGNFKGSKEEYNVFLRYALTHEFLHHMSGTVQNVCMTDDGLSEGITDMLAQEVSGNKKDKSELYDFPVGVCELLSTMVGKDKLLSDYLFSLDTCPNLNQMFEECGCNQEDFQMLRSMLGNVISVSALDRKEGKPKEEFALEQKRECLSFLQTKLVLNYCNKYPDKRETVMAAFDNLINDSQIKEKIVVEDIDSRKK